MDTPGNIMPIPGTWNVEFYEMALGPSNGKVRRNVDAEYILIYLTKEATTDQLKTDNTQG
jgi:hypothetical protein